MILKNSSLILSLLLCFLFFSCQSNYDDTNENIQFKYNPSANITLVDSLCYEKELVMIVNTSLDTNENILAIFSNYQFGDEQPIEFERKLLEKVNFRKAENNMFTIEYDSSRNEHNFGRTEVCFGNNCELVSCGEYSLTELEKFCFKKSSNREICEKGDSCMFVDSVCKPLNCKYFDNEEMCKNNELCIYSKVGNYSCHNKQCKFIEDQDQCNKISKCSWDQEYNSCDDIRCYEYESKSACKKQEYCQWEERENFDFCANIDTLKDSFEFEIDYNVLRY